ncbi:hypothetical protein C8Q72DRAFT_96955 [Fomitopsis betulina]|nr:hypothetical protein C8Q72DRAFT_96955 [Fomitopsis betulina]
MPLFGKSKAQKAEQRAAEHHDNAHNDPNTHGAGIGGSRDERGQHDSNTNAFGHNSGSNREGGIGHQHAHDSNAMSQGTGVGAQDYAQHNNALGHNTRDGGAGYQGNGPLGIASGTDTRHHNGHQGGPVDRADQRVEGAIGARAIQNQGILESKTVCGYIDAAMVRAMVSDCPLSQVQVHYGHECLGPR